MILRVCSVAIRDKARARPGGDAGKSRYWPDFRRLGTALLLVACLGGWPGSPSAQQPPPPPSAPLIPPPLTGSITTGKLVELRALDKVTARLSVLTLEIGKPARFGQIDIQVLACVTRPPTEPPDHLAFLRITEIRRDTAPRIVFSGWMFASSPAINPLEHPVYDVWVVECRG